MKKNFICLLINIFVILGCGRETSEPDKFVPVPAKSQAAPPESSPADVLKANAVQATDFHGQALQALGEVQDEYQRAGGLVPGVGKVSLFLDVNFNLLIRNEADGMKEEIRANLKNLDSNPASYQFYPEGTKGAFPGMRIPTLDNKRTVEVRKNNATTQQDHIEIFLADQKAISRALNGFLFAIRAAQGQPVGE